jgi:catechol 2,3-dioxygenase-like lactoylglutathione lyase family enzyme
VTPTITHVFAGIPTADLAVALEWYERLLGAPPDRFPHENEAVWQLVDRGLIYVVRDPTRSGTALVTLIVDHLDEWIAAATGRGVAVGKVETQSGGVRKVTVTDPDGNLVGVGEVPSGPGAA